MDRYLIAPHLESKLHKPQAGFKKPYPIMFSAGGLQPLAALTPEHRGIKAVDGTTGEKADFDYPAGHLGGRA